MKKLILTNIIVVIVFMLFDPLLNFSREWADTYNIGAEMLLGMFTPLLFAIFILTAVCLILFSIIKSIVNEDAKQLTPISVFIASIIVYIFIFGSDGFWASLVNYYIIGVTI